MKTAIDLGYITATEIIEELGGTREVAEFLNIKAPSVSDWKSSGTIPHDKLIRLATRIEAKTDHRLTRKILFPGDWQIIWPELLGLAVDRKESRDIP